MKKALFISLMMLSASFAMSATERPDSDETPQDVNQYGQTVQSLPVTANLQDGILVFQNKDEKYKLWFDIRVQGDAAVYFGAPDYCAKQLDGKDNTNHIGNGMSIRRARFAVKAQLGKSWYGELDTDWTSGSPEIKDAILAYTGVPGLEIKAGNFKENFSIQRNTTSRYLMFMERAMVTSLAPSRHLGINARYAYKWFWVAAGVFGPELKGGEEMTAMEDGNKDFGFNEGLSYTGKVVFRPLYKSQDASLHIGGAFSYREPKLTSTDGYNVVRYSSRNSTNINRKKYLDTDVIKGLDHELAWTVELAGHWKQLRYEAAYIARGAYLDQSKNPMSPQWAEGWYAQASWLLFGGSQNYDSDGAKYTRTTSDRKWGNLEIAFRYEYCDFNTGKLFSRKASDVGYWGGSGEAYTIGLNYYPHKNVKIVLNWQYNNNDRYANGKGKLYTGYDLEGNPTKDPTKVVAANGKAGVDYQMIALRFQVAF
ncbi:MAG: OprO/OprP family phosphate-selective porin [Candidatus Cryptobacteroides sp.]